MASVLSEIAGETKDQAVVGIIMVSDRGLAQLFGIRKIPMVFVMHNAEITASFVGITSKEQIVLALR